MRNFLAGILVSLGSIALLGAAMLFAVMPRLDWGAAQNPGVIQQRLAKAIISRWVQTNASAHTNPLSPTPENLKSAQNEYGEHCAACHALDGSGRNHFEASFYPPIPKLTSTVQELSDGDLYFIISNGIRDTGMPSFAKRHSPDDIWAAALWVRHLGQLSDVEKAEIESRMKQDAGEHERTMHLEH